LPQKTLLRETDPAFLEERAFHLEQFMKKVYKLSYIKESDELAVFGRYVKPAGNPNAPEVDFHKKVNSLPSQNGAMLAFRIRQACQGTEVSEVC
jgi:hypothetical protein